jgi:hypothetical protein
MNTTFIPLNTQGKFAKERPMQHAIPSSQPAKGISGSLASPHPLRAALMAIAVVTTAMGMGNAQAQTIEDHSLPRSVIKTFHVTCSGGRLGKIRYDTRTEPTRMCASVTDGSRTQSCVNVTRQQAPGHVNVLGGWVCQ